MTRDPFSRHGASEPATPESSPHPAAGAARIRLRRATVADADALCAFEQAAFSGDRMSRRQFRHHARAPSSDLIVATGGDQLLGYALLLRRHGLDSARIYSVAVSAAARGQGLGTRLLGRMERIARSHELSEIRLEVRQDNDSAIRLYERRGYRRFGARLDYYEDGCNAWRLSKSLLSRAHQPTLPSA